MLLPTNRRACAGPIAGVSIFAALTPAVLTPARPAAADPLPWRAKSDPFGAVVAMGNRVRVDDVDAYVALLREAGVQWTREEIFWDKVQRVPGGPFTWNGDGSGFYDYDRSIGAPTAAGLHISGLL